MNITAPRNSCFFSSQTFAVVAAAVFIRTFVSSKPTFCIARPITNSPQCPHPQVYCKWKSHCPHETLPGMSLNTSSAGTVCRCAIFPHVQTKNWKHQSARLRVVYLFNGLTNVRQVFCQSLFFEPRNQMGRPNILFRSKLVRRSDWGATLTNRWLVSFTLETLSLGTTIFSARSVATGSSMMTTNLCV